MVNSEVGRIFVIEPGLIKMTGHPIQYALALQQLCQQQGIEIHVISNRKVKKETLDCFSSSFPGISHTCFEFVPSGEMIFSDDLDQLQEYYNFSQSDLVIVTSSYTKEIEGIAHFVGHTKDSLCPRIAMNFHQLFPPANVSETVCTSDYQALWLARLSKAFKTIESTNDKISFWTTTCEALNEAYQHLTSHPIKTLPFLFSETVQTTISARKSHSDKFRIAFLGDGREEKGLRIFLNAIHSLGVSGQLEFVIQNIDARGYDQTGQVAVNSLLAQTKSNPNICIIEEPLSPKAFRNLIYSIDAVVLPYHPKHYDKRGSMVFVEACLSGKPTIVSRGTWMANEIKKHNASGLVFDYLVTNSEATTNNLQLAILELQKSIRLYQIEAENCPHYYRSYHTAETYLEFVLTHYNQ